jgi:hypothetical protein
VTGGLEPSEEYDGRLTVHVLRDRDSKEKIVCHSYREAIETVRRKNESAVATKIEDRDGTIVFSSDEIDIDDWVVEWEDQMRSLAVDVDAHDCPYGNVACVSDDLCVQCKMDKVQDQY